MSTWDSNLTDKKLRSNFPLNKFQTAGCRSRPQYLGGPGYQGNLCTKANVLIVLLLISGHSSKKCFGIHARLGRVL